MQLTRAMTRRRTLAGMAVAFVAMAGVACTPPASGGGTTVPTTPPASTVKAVTNATFEWTVSAEANAAAQNGQWNWFSAGQSDGTELKYLASNGNATVYKKNTAGNYVVLNSEPSVSWANRGQTGSTPVTIGNGGNLGQKIRYTGGTGTVNTATGEATIQWTGTFSLNYYGNLVPFWIVDPKLVVNSAGVGTLTSGLGGYSSDQSNPNVRTLLTPVASAVIATIPVTNGANSTGFTSATGYRGTAVTTDPAQVGQLPWSSANNAYWGSWPQQFVNFQNQTGLSSYWYTSGGMADPKKPQDPISVLYNIPA